VIHWAAREGSYLHLSGTDFCIRKQKAQRPDGPNKPTLRAAKESKGERRRFSYAQSILACGGSRTFGRLADGSKPTSNKPQPITVLEPFRKP
jgi:hypothetical protein